MSKLHEQMTSQQHSLNDQFVRLSTESSSSSSCLCKNQKTANLRRIQYAFLFVFCCFFFFNENLNRLPTVVPLVEILCCQILCSAETDFILVKRFWLKRTSETGEYRLEGSLQESQRDPLCFCLFSYIYVTAPDDEKAGF